jgi:hypothetical protein
VVWFVQIGTHEDQYPERKHTRNGPRRWNAQAGQLATVAYRFVLEDGREFLDDEQRHVPREEAATNRIPGIVSVQ